MLLKQKVGEGEGEWVRLPRMLYNIFLPQFSRIRQLPGVGCLGGMEPTVLERVACPASASALRRELQYCGVVVHLAHHPPPIVFDILRGMCRMGFSVVVLRRAWAGWL